MLSRSCSPRGGRAKGVGRGWGEPMLAAGARKPSLERRTTLVGQRPPACKSGPTFCVPAPLVACPGEWPSPLGRPHSGFLSSRFRICLAVVSQRRRRCALPYPSQVLELIADPTTPGAAHVKSPSDPREDESIAALTSRGFVHRGACPLSVMPLLCTSIAPPLAPGIGIRRPCIRLVFIFMSL